MYYLVEGYYTHGGRLSLGAPKRASVVVIQQLLGTIRGMLEDKSEVDTIVITRTTEEVFMTFYQNRRKKSGKR